MALKFSELQKIERILIATAGECDAQIELERILDRPEWGGLDPDVVGVLTRLANVARTAACRRSAQLALGALLYVTKEWKSDRGKCHAVLQFVNQRIDSIETAGMYWANVVLANDEEADARALFEAAKGDETYTTEELRVGARQFIENHQGEDSIFGRMSADLARLLDILDDQERSDSHRELARAALTYFIEVADAIPDELGLVGFLDDAFIIQQAVDQVLPGRADLTGYLEEKTRQWPFLRNLCITKDGQGHPVSDYFLINCALLLDLLKKGGQSSAVVVSDSGPVPYLVGLVGALAYIGEGIRSEDFPALKDGDRLMDRDGHGEVIFKGYLHAEGTAFTPCGRSIATHVQLTYPARGRQAEMVQTIPLPELGNFRRTAIGVDKRKKAKIKIDVGNREAGPLEQLFGTNRPIMLSAHSPQVLVVAPIERTRSLARALSLFGVAVADAVPTAHLRRDEDDFSVNYWTKHGLGGEPILCIMRSIDEAYDYVLSPLFENRNIANVVAPVRPDSADANQLARIAEQGVSVLAFVEPGDIETIEILSERKTSFWSWDQDWFGLLYWPAATSDGEHPIAVYERQIRRRVKLSYEVETISCDQLAEASRTLASMSKKGDAADLDPLGMWTIKGWGVLLRLCRQLTPLTSEERERFGELTEELSSDIDANRRRWTEDVEEQAQKVVRALKGVISMLAERNPKSEMVERICREHSGVTVVVAERDRIKMTKHLSGYGVRVGSSILPGRDEGLIVLPAWYERSRMEGMVFGSTADEFRLVLYEPEAAWFDSALRRRSASVRLAKNVVAKNASIPISEDLRGTDSIHRERATGEFGDLDGVLRSSIHRFIHTKRREAPERSVSARVVGFLGGCWAAFTRYHDLIMVNHLFDDESDTTPTVVVTDVNNIESGDILLLLGGSDRDAVRARAEQNLTAETIERSALWKRALNEYLQLDEDFESLRMKLRHEGCDKTLSTIRHWIVKEGAIGPQRVDVEIPAIARATGNKHLIQEESECIAAISAVRSAHITAGKWLAGRVIQRAKEWVAAGSTPSDLVELEDRLVMVTVDFVDTEETEIPSSIVNRLQDSQWRR